MAVLHVPLTSLLLLATDQESYEKAYFLTKNIEDNSGGKKTRQTEEEVGRQHQGIDWRGVQQVPDGS